MDLDTRGYWLELGGCAAQRCASMQPQSERKAALLCFVVVRVR